MRNYQILLLGILVATAGCGSESSQGDDSGAPDAAADGLDSADASDGQALDAVGDSSDGGGGSDADSGDAPLDATVDVDPGDSEAGDTAPDDTALDDTGRPDSAVADADAGAPEFLCPAGWSAPEQVGLLEPGKLPEISGLAASHRTDGVLWAHNDSGDSPVLTAIDTTGSALGTLTLPVDSEDFEDIATAACPDGTGHCIWVADIGNNLLLRDTVYVYAAREPDVTRGDGAWTPDKTWTYPIRYPGGPANAEALVVAADGSALWILEKVEAPTARVFGTTAALTPNLVMKLSEIAEFSAPGVAIEKGRLITGADLHPNQLDLAVRVYTGSFVYRLPNPLDFGALGELEPQLVAYGPFSEPQGEAIAWAAEEPVLYTASEDAELTGQQPLHRYQCAPDGGD